MSQFIEGEPLGIIAEVKRGIAVTLALGPKAIKFALLPALLYLATVLIFELNTQGLDPGLQQIVNSPVLFAVTLLGDVYYTIYLFRYFLVESHETSQNSAILRFGPEERQFFKWTLYMFMIMAPLGVVFFIIYIHFENGLVICGELVGLKFTIIENARANPLALPADMTFEYLKSIDEFDPYKLGDWVLSSYRVLSFASFFAFIGARYAFLFTAAVAGTKTSVSSAKKLLGAQFRPLFLITIGYVCIVMTGYSIMDAQFDKQSLWYILIACAWHLFGLLLAVFDAYITTRYYQRALDAQ